jgi:xanthine dehydrogenase accessory factor
MIASSPLNEVPATVSESVYRAIVEALDSRARAAVVTIVATNGSTPQRVGAKMLVYEDGRIAGTIGGGCYEHDAAGKARDAIRTRRPLLARYALNDDLAAESGLICGGQMDVYIEPIEAAPDLYLLGAGHVSVEIARMAQLVGFRVHVVDDRQKFANADRFPGADVIVDDIAGWLAQATIPAEAYVVVVTRGHRYDHDAMRQLISRPTRYLGLIGSRAKVVRIFDALADEGADRSALAGVHAPIGLDIGAVTPAEIAVSIVAELVAVRSGRIGEPHVSAASLKTSLKR